MIEKIISKEQAKHRGYRFYYYGSFRSRHIDLVFSGLPGNVGVIFRFKDFIRRSDLTPLKSALKRGIISRGYMINPGKRAFFGGKGIVTVPADYFLDQYDFFTSEAMSTGDIRWNIRRYNESARAPLLDA